MTQCYNDTLEIGEGFCEDDSSKLRHDGCTQRSRSAVQHLAHGNRCREVGVKVIDSSKLRSDGCTKKSRPAVQHHVLGDNCSEVRVEGIDSSRLRSDGCTQKSRSAVQHHVHDHRGSEAAIEIPSTSLAAMIFWYGLPRAESSASVPGQARSTRVDSKRPAQSAASCNHGKVKAGDRGGSAQSSDVLFFSSASDALRALDYM